MDELEHCLRAQKLTSNILAFKIIIIILKTEFFWLLEGTSLKMLVKDFSYDINGMIRPTSRTV